MERITLILITEKERLILREDVTSAFRKTGDHLLYLFPPCIVLGGASDIRRHVTLPERFTLSEGTGSNEWGSYRAFMNDEDISRIQEELGLPVIPTGLHISYDKDNSDFEPRVESVRAYALAEALHDGNSFRVIRQKRF